MRSFWEIYNEPDEDDEPAKPKPASSGNTNYVGGGVNPAYTNAAYQSEMDKLLSAQPGTRNHTLNEVTFQLARFAFSGDLDGNTLVADLTRNAQAIGLPPGEINTTIRSAWDGAWRKIGDSRGAPPPLPGIAPAFVIDNNGNGSAVNGSAAPEPISVEELHRIKVESRAYELRINEEARLLWSAQQAATLNQNAPDPINLVDFLAVPDEDATYRIEGLLPVGARALFVAQYKTGKTTSIANLVRSLADGQPYMMRWPVRQVSKVTIIDTELDERMLRRWLRKQWISNPERIDVLPLKGRLASFNILDPATRAQWAARLADSEFVILDCLRPCLDALGMSEDKDGGKFCVAWDALMTEARVEESVLVHHSGHNSERSRGDSRLLDWPDVIWKLVKESQDDEGSAEIGSLHDGGQRFFSAHGRDVNVPECMVEYEPQTGGLRALEGSRGDFKARGALPDLMEILGAPDADEGLTLSALESRLKACGHGRNVARKAVRQAIKEGAIVVSQGAHNASVHTLNPSHRSAQ